MKLVCVLYCNYQVNNAHFHEGEKRRRRRRRTERGRYSCIRLLYVIYLYERVDVDIDSDFLWSFQFSFKFVYEVASVFRPFLSTSHLFFVRFRVTATIELSFFYFFFQNERVFSVHALSQSLFMNHESVLSQQIVNISVWFDGKAMCFNHTYELFQIFFSFP